MITIENLDIWTMNNLNSYLVRATKHADNLEPDLATHWEVSEDGTTYTFHMREAKFSDGTPVTAQDAKFSIERARDHPASFMAALYQNITSIETPDERTVVITLREPSAPFLSTIAMFPASILPQKVVEERGEDFGSNPIGAGAFRLKEWRRGVVIVLERNPHYWEEGLPLVDQVEWHVVSEDNTRILKVQAGELDAALFVPFNRIAELEATARSISAMVAHNLGSAKSHSGVWRDLAVRKRPTEVEPMIGAVVREAARHSIDTPLLARLTAMIHEIEEGRRPLDRANIRRGGATGGLNRWKPRSATRR